MYALSAYIQINLGASCKVTRGCSFSSHKRAMAVLGRKNKHCTPYGVLVLPCPALGTALQASKLLEQGKRIR
jgi:hypothetical protein